MIRLPYLASEKFQGKKYYVDRTSAAAAFFFPVVANKPAFLCVKGVSYTVFLRTQSKPTLIILNF